MERKRRWMAVATVAVLSLNKAHNVPGVPSLVYIAASMHADAPSCCHTHLHREAVLTRAAQLNGQAPVLPGPPKGCSQGPQACSSLLRERYQCRATCSREGLSKNLLLLRCQT